MPNLLIRGLSPRIHREVEKMAESQNLSVNQMLLRLIASAVEQKDDEEEKRRREEEAFRRIREIREENYRKYGLSDDSTKLIREDRDSH